METMTEVGTPEPCSICGCSTAPDDEGVWHCTNPFCSNYPRDGRHLYNEGWYREHLILRDDPDKEN
jgi:hypothetical protein